MVSRNILSHLAVLIIIGGVVNDALGLTTPIVDPHTVHIACGLIGGPIYAAGVVLHRRNALEPGEPLAFHYASSLGKHLMSDILGVMASFAFLLSAIVQLIPIPTTEILMLMIGIVVGVVGFCLIFRASVIRSQKVYADAHVRSEI